MTDPVLTAKPILERFSLSGRHALVTGAGQGIGRAYAHALAEAGAAVAIVDINTETAAEVSEELKSKGARSIPVQADVTDEQAIEEAFEEIVSIFGSLEIAVNNAGASIWCDSEKHEKTDWDRIIGLNLTGVFLCCKKEADLMLPKGYGKIINTASMSGHIVNIPQNQTAYNTSKAGVIHMTRSLAAEWADRGVRVNSISPGYTKTKLVANLLNTEIGKNMEPKWLSLTPMGSMLQVTDLQGAVVYLASEVSDYVTGADILVDGGYCAW